MNNRTPDYAAAVCYDCMATDANGRPDPDYAPNDGSCALELLEYDTTFVGFGENPACVTPGGLTCEGHFGRECATCTTTLAGTRYCVTVLHS